MIALFPLCLVSVVGLYGEGGASLGGWPGPRGQAVLVPKLLPRHDLVLTRSVSWLLLDKYLMQMALIFCMDVWQICCVDGINNLCEWNSHLVWITVINCMNDMIFFVDDIDILCESHWYLVWLKFSPHLSRTLKWAFLITICLLSVVVVVGVVVVNFSHFHLILQNQWANFNQTWHKGSLGDRDSSMFKWRGTPFSKGR